MFLENKMHLNIVDLSMCDRPHCALGFDEIIKKAFRVTNSI